MKTEKLKDKKWMIDVIGIGGVLLFVIMALLHVYSTELCIRYKDATGARHFMQAAQIAQGVYHGGSVSLVAYVQALFIKVASAFVPCAGLYQAFLVSEIVLRMVETLLFYRVVRNMGKSVLMRIASPVLTMLYFFGYPAISVLWGNYDYWNGNAILVLLFLLLFGFAERKWGDKVLAAGKWKIPAKSLISVAVLAFFLSYYLIYWYQIGINELEQTAVTGMFRNIYGDVIFFVPALVFVVLHFFLDREGSAVITFSGMAMLLATIFLYVQWHQGNIDSYYHYLNQYNVWLMGWLLAAASIQIGVKTRQLPAVASYAGMYLIILALVLGGFDRYMWNHNPNYNNSYSTVNLCAVYRQTLDGLLVDYKQYDYDTATLENYAEVVEQHKGETGKTAILTSDEATQYWYDGVTGADSGEYRLDRNEFPDIIQKLDEQEIETLIVDRNSDAEQGQIDFYLDYLEKCKISEENGILICKPIGSSWTDISALTGGYDSAKTELFELAAPGGQYAGAPFLADKSSYLDYIMYQNITGVSMKDFYTWHYSPVDNITRLNEQEIRHIVLLYDDLYYLNTKPYFEKQTVVYENEAGCILTYSGDSWATTY